MELKQQFGFIEFTVDATIERDARDVYDFVTPISGTLRGLLADTLSDREVIAGKIHGYRLHLSEAHNHGVRIVDVFDVCDLETFFHVLIADSETTFRKEALPGECHGDAIRDILVISNIALKKYFRRQGLGALMVGSFVELFGAGCLFAALSIEPAREREGMDEEFRRDMALHLFEQDPEKARGKLITYWERHHFRHVPGTDVMTMGLPRSPD